MKKLFETPSIVMNMSAAEIAAERERYQKLWDDANSMVQRAGKTAYAPKAYTGNTAADLSTQQERANLKLQAFADGYRSGKVVTWYKNEERSLRWWDEEDSLGYITAKAPAPAQEVWDEEQAMFVTR